MRMGHKRLGVDVLAQPAAQGEFHIRQVERAGATRRDGFPHRCAIEGEIRDGQRGQVDHGGGAACRLIEHTGFVDDHKGHALRIVPLDHDAVTVAGLHAERSRSEDARLTADQGRQRVIAGRELEVIRGEGKTDPGKDDFLIDRDVHHRAVRNEG